MPDLEKIMIYRNKPPYSDVGMDQKGTYYPKPPNFFQRSFDGGSSSGVLPGALGGIFGGAGNTKQQPVAQQQRQQSPTIPVPVEAIGAIVEDEKKKENITGIPSSILKMLPSLLATGVGLASGGNTNVLAGAAGFSQGYSKELSEQRKMQEEALKQYIKDNQLEDVYIVQDGQLKKTDQQVRSKDRVINQQSGLGWLGDIPEMTPPKTTNQLGKEAIQNQSGISEEDILFTMKKHGLSREEVLKRIGQ